MSDVVHELSTRKSASADACCSFDDLIRVAPPDVDPSSGAETDGDDIRWWQGPNKPSALQSQNPQKAPQKMVHAEPPLVCGCGQTHGPKTQCSTWGLWPNVSSPSPKGGRGGQRSAELL